MGIRRPFTLSEYIEGIRRGDRRMLAKALSLLESNRETDKDILLPLLDYCYRDYGRAIHVGVTGSPGAGKSTFLESFLLYLLEQEPSVRVAVIAIDPSSVRSGGSIMGDALRMERLAVQERAFVRTVPSRGHLGGIAPSTMAMCMLFNAAGYDWIFIETVGVGQNEVRIIDVADLYLLLVPPASGDEIQGMKRGIMEIADLVLVTKNDGPYKAIARQTLVSYRQALRLLGPNLDGIQAEVINISSLERKGFDEVKKKMDELVTYMKSKGIMAKRKERQIANFIREQLLTEALQILFRHPEINATYHHLMAEMRTHQRAPHSVIHLLMEKIEKVIGNPGNG